MTNPNRPPGLIQRYRQELQARHYARRTVKTYEQWLRRFPQFHGMRHSREMPQRSGAGNGYFPSIGAGKIQLQNNRGAIISIRV
jgi:hypothetical protein